MLQLTIQTWATEVVVVVGSVVVVVAVGSVSRATVMLGGGVRLEKQKMKFKKSQNGTKLD